MKANVDSTPWGIHWFRRDLRAQGNFALKENARRMKGRTLGLFCFDSKFLSRDDFSYNRFAFFLKTLESLRDDLRASGGDLLVVDSLPLEAMKTLLKFCDESKRPRPNLISWGRDYEPFARTRDQKMIEFLNTEMIENFNHRDHLLFEPTEILKSENQRDYYKVYSPWSKKWFKALNSDEGHRRVAEIAGASGQNKSSFSLTWQSFAGDFPLQDAYLKFEAENKKHVHIPIPKAGFKAGMAEVRKFRPKLQNYHLERDYPALDATSQISMFLKNGSITIANVLHELELTDTKFEEVSGRSKYVRELAWREFYYAILYHRPEVETGPFQEKYRHIDWNEDQDLFKRWQEGSTGFPIVDAAMRELKQTGWITNRVRIIVAAFLSKDLLLNWQWGEKHFMHLLLDGDLAPNNGNWQWAASTGSDPNPYFRILNPWSQGEKFDPKGEYIRRFIPELRDAPVRALHDPDVDRSRWNYPAPIVDHSAQRPKAIAQFKSV